MNHRPMTKPWLRFDPLVAILTLPIALFFIYYELDTPKANIPQAIGPEVMPIGILCLLIINAVVLFFVAAFGKGKTAADAEEQAQTEEEAGATWRDKYQTLLLVLLGLIVYAVFLVPLGFIICTAFLLLYEARLLQPGHWVRNVLVAVGFSVGVYLTFVKFLNVMLPAGVLG